MSNFECIHATNLSEGWAKAVMKLTAPGVTEVAPLLVTISEIGNNEIAETIEIRDLLDRTLRGMKTGLSIDMVAGTIFPSSLWNPERSRRQLYQRYLKILPRVRRDRRNRHGVYFERHL